MNDDSKTSSTTQEFLPAVRRAPFGELTLYEITESELELLERGPPDSLFLNFAISLLSVAISMSVTFATSTIPSDRAFIVLVLLTIVGYVAGLLLLILWWRTNRSKLAVAAAIRRRLPPRGIQEPSQSAG